MENKPQTTENKPQTTEHKATNIKEELIANIKEWIKLDNELTKIKLEIKLKTIKRKELTETLVNTMKNNSIDCFNINGGALIYKQKKTKKTISGKYLLAQLEEYYKDTPDVAKDITKRVLDNRTEVIKDEIKRKIDK
jgi:hypothetical protein